MSRVRRARAMASGIAWVHVIALAAALGGRDGKQTAMRMAVRAHARRTGQQ